MQKECIIWGAESMNYLKSEEEVEKLIEEMKLRTKGNYITQGVSFNKDCPRQMDLLKNALMGSASFSGLIKELLALKYSNDNINTNVSKIEKTYIKEEKDSNHKEEVQSEKIINEKPINITETIEVIKNNITNNDNQDDDLGGVDGFS